LTGECVGGELAGRIESCLEGPGSNSPGRGSDWAKRTRPLFNGTNDDSGSIEGERGNRDPGIVIDLALLRPSLGNGGGPITSRLDRAERVSEGSQFTFTGRLREKLATLPSSLEARCRRLPVERWRLRFRWFFDTG